MYGGISRPMLAMFTFAVGLALVVSLVTYGFVIPLHSPKRAFQDLGNNLIYSWGTRVEVSVNLVYYGQGTVDINGAILRGEKSLWHASGHWIMRNNTPRSIHFDIGGSCKSDLVINRIYDVTLNTSIGQYTVKATYVGSAIGVANTVDWAQFMKDPSNSGYYGGSPIDPEDVEGVKFRIPYIGAFTDVSTPSIGYGWLWFGVDDGNDYALVRVNLTDVSDIAYFPDWGSSTFSPISGYGRIYTANDDTVYAIDPLNANSADWSMSFPGAVKIYTGALYHASLYVPVVFANGTSLIAKLDPITGEMESEYWLNSAVVNALTAAGNRIVFGTEDGRVIILDADTLEPVAEASVEGSLMEEYAFAAGGQLLFVPTVTSPSSGMIYVISLQDGSVKSAIELSFYKPTSNGVLKTGHFYIGLRRKCGSYKAAIFDLNLVTGEYSIHAFHCSTGIRYIDGLSTAGSYLYGTNSRCGGKRVFRIDPLNWDLSSLGICCGHGCKRLLLKPPIFYNKLYVVGILGGGGCHNHGESGSIMVYAISGS